MDFLIDYVPVSKIVNIMTSSQVFWNLPQIVQGRTFWKIPLPAAAANGNMEVVRFLVKRKRHKRKIYDHAIYAASSRGYLSVLEFLIAWYPFKKIPHQNALLYACNRGQLEIVKFITTRWTKYTRYKYIKCRFEWIYKGGFLDDLTTLGLSLLVSSKKGHIAVVRYLTNPRLAYCDGKLEFESSYRPFHAPLENACEYGHAEVAQHLFQSVIGPLNDVSASIVLKRVIQNGDLEKVKLIYSVWKHCNDKSDLLVIKFACKAGYLEIIKFLNSRPDRGCERIIETMLQACRFNQLKIVKCLMSVREYRLLEIRSAQGLAQAIEYCNVLIYKYLKRVCIYSKRNIKKAYELAGEHNPGNTCLFVLGTVALRECRKMTRKISRYDIDFSLPKIRRAFKIATQNGIGNNYFFFKEFLLRIQHEASFIISSDI